MGKWIEKPSGWFTYKNGNRQIKAAITLCMANMESSWCWRARVFVGGVMLVHDRHYRYLETAKHAVEGCVNDY